MIVMSASRLLLAAVLAIGGLGIAGGTGPANAAEEQFKQVKLSDDMIKGFISAQKDMADFAQKSGAQPNEKPDPKVQAELDAIAKKHGFTNFVEFDDVAFNISMVMGGLDPQSGAFTDPIAAIKKEMEEITADKTIPEKDRKQMLDELAEALKNTPPLKFPENVDVVKKYRVDIEKVLQ